MKGFAVRLAFIAFIGAVVSAYLIYHFVEVRSGLKLEPSFCTISETFDCDLVAKSAYSSLFGIPVAGYGLMYYLGFLTFVLLGRGVPGEGRTVGEGEQNDLLARRASFRFFLASLSLPISAALAVVSKVSLHTYCLMCMVLYAVNIALFLLTLIDPERPRTGFASWTAGALELIRLPTNTACLPPFPFFVFIAGEIALTLILPTVFLEGFVKPHAARARDRAVLMVPVNVWRNMPVVTFPEFDPPGSFSPDVASGDAKAPVTIVEFSDLECPACHLLAPYLSEAIEHHKGKVRFVFKHFPLDKTCNSLIKGDKHPSACYAAQMAVCAGRQGNGALLKFVDAAFKLFTVNKETLNALPEKLGLDKGAFSACMETEDSLNRVKSDVELGLKLGVFSTPTLYVNGRILQKVPANLLDGVLGLIIEETERGRPPG